MGKSRPMNLPQRSLFGDGLFGAGVPCVAAVSAEGLRVSPMGESPLVEQGVAFAEMSVEAGGLDHDQLVVSWGPARLARTPLRKIPP